MARSIDEFVTTTEHGLIDHAGIDGVGTKGQNNSGPLQGPRPTLNFIPSGGAGVSVVENVGQNRIDITISAPSGGGFTTVAIARGALPGYGTSFSLNSGDVGVTGIKFCFAFLGWNNADVSWSMGWAETDGSPPGFSQNCLTCDVGAAHLYSTRGGIGGTGTGSGGNVANLVDNGGGTNPSVDVTSGANAFTGVALAFRLT